MQKRESGRGRRGLPRGGGWEILAIMALTSLINVGTLSGQTAEGGALPEEVAAEIVDFYNDGATVRMIGSSQITRGSEVTGGIVVLEGPVRVAGKIAGRLVVINGDVILEPGAEVTGDLLVVGGVVRGLETVPLKGAVVVYRAPLRFRVQGDRIALAPDPEPALATGRDFGFGRTDILLASRRGYNRVEGLPIVVGPRIETRSLDPVRIELLAIFRTATGLQLQPRRMGYLARLEKSFASRALWLKLGLRSEIEPIEALGLTDRENSLSTFLMHRDYRDHYQRQGWSAGARLAPVGGRFALELEYRDEEHSPVRERDPWTLFRGSESWRSQPMVAEGRLRSLVLDLEYDTRNESHEPTTGWYAHTRFERGLGGTLAMPSQLPTGDPLPGPSVSIPVDPAFAVGTLDLRRYARLGPTSRLALRAFASSSLNDRPLPAQRQRLLGGPGSLPGYGSFEFDCGARGQTGRYEEGTFYPYYGCDRAVLFQLEYRNDLSLGRGWGRKLGHDVDLGEKIGWVIFFDAGRTWVEREASTGRTTGMDDFAADVGLGLRFGLLGLYWAMPLNGDDRYINFSLRLGPRL